jgi:hypothetical protein
MVFAAHSPQRCRERRERAAKSSQIKSRPKAGSKKEAVSFEKRKVNATHRYQGETRMPYAFREDRNRGVEIQAGGAREIRWFKSADNRCKFPKELFYSSDLASFVSMTAPINPTEVIVC